MKTKIKIIIITLLGLLSILGYSVYHDYKMDEYAKINNCTWVIQGSHDICK